MTMSSKRVLITGGNGYVGRRVTQMLSDDQTVCVVDNLRYGDWRFSAAARERLKLETADIRDAAAMADIMDRFVPNVIVHLAAVHYIPECERDPLLAVSTNVLGTLNLLLTCPEGCRFVFASSGAVYKPDEAPHHETSSALAPSDVYGRSKLQGEEYVQDFVVRRGLTGVIVRLFNVIGPGETNPHLLPELVAQLKAGRQVVRLGNLSPKRDYISVEDAARGFVAVADGAAVEQGQAHIVNLGTSKAYSVAEILGRLRNISGINFEVRQEVGRLRSVDRPFLAADVGKINDLFGWKPAYTIDETLREMWRDPDLSSGLMAQYQ